MLKLASLLRLIGMLIAFVIAVGIALVALEAKESGQLVGPWLDVSRFLTEPFDRLIDLERGREKLQIGINWGIAALIYVVVASVLARLIGRGHRSRLRKRRAATRKTATR